MFGPNARRVPAGETVQIETDWVRPDEAMSATVDQLYREHRGWLAKRLEQRIGCQERAADLTQSTFLRLMISWAAEQVRDPKAVLATIANGLMIDEIRRRDLERRYVQSLVQQGEAEAVSSEDRVVILDMLVRIDQMLDGLKPRTRRVFLMSRLSGVPYTEIALKLAVSLSTVEKDMAQALAHCYRIRYGD